MTLAEYFMEVVLYQAKHRHSQRLGQMFFNVLANTRSELDAQVRGSRIDPFYDDERLPAFLQFIADAW